MDKVVSLFVMAEFAGVATTTHTHKSICDCCVCRGCVSSIDHVYLVTCEMWSRLAEATWDGATETNQTNRDSNRIPVAVNKVLRPRVSPPQMNS